MAMIPTHIELQELAYAIWEDCGKPESTAKKDWDTAVSMYADPEMGDTSGPIFLPCGGKYNLPRQ